MTQFFTRLGCAAVLTSAIFGANAATDEAGNNFIYLAGLAGPENYPPAEQYADAWEAAKMPETSPGSNIYEITVDLNTLTWGAWFRFYYDLAKGLNDADIYNAFNLNLIQPHADGSVNIDGVRPLMAGNSGIYGDAPADRLPVAAALGTWNLPYGTYKLRVNLNNMTFRAIPSETVLMLVNDESDPATGSPADYTEITRMKNYVEPCDNLKIRLYDIFNNKWLNPSPGFETIDLGTDSSFDFTFQSSDSKGEPFTLSDWKGGVVSGSYYWGSYRGSFLSDETPEYVFTPISPDVIYYVGDFSEWEFTEAERQPGNQAIYNVTFPAGTNYFKMSLNNTWSGDEIGVGDILSTDGGNTVYELRISEQGNLANHEFSQGLTSPVTVVVNLSEGTMTVPTDANAKFQYVSVGGSVAPVERDAMFIATPFDSFTPWKDCSDAVLSSFPILTKQADGTYSGQIYIPAGQFKLNIISELTDRNLPNKVIAPPSGTDRALAIADRKAYSSATELSADNAGYWTYSGENLLDGWGGGTVTITVTPGNTPSVYFDLSSALPDEQAEQIYLVGSPNGWDVSDGSMPLRLTSNGGYYGYYPVDDEAVFRFYTTLGDWGNDASLPSIGANAYDGYNTDIIVAGSDQYRGSCTPGKGSWILNGWNSGDILYMYVNVSQGLVIFSGQPISEAGDIVDPSTVKTLYVYQNGQYTKLTEGNDGIFRGYCDGYNPFRLFTRQLPISPEEAEWGGSYALTIPGEATSRLSFDEFNVAEFNVTASDGVSADGGTEFIIPELDVPGRLNIAVNLETGKIYVEAPGSFYYLCGGLTDGKLPTFENRNDFADYRIHLTGGIIDIPAGKFDFSFIRSISDASLMTTPAEIVFTDGYVGCDPDNMFGWQFNRVTCSGWAGGKVIVCTNQMLDLSSLSSLTALTYMGGIGLTNSTLTQTAPGSLIYKGKATFADRTNPWLQFLLHSEESPTGNPRNLTVMSSAYNSGIGYTVNAGAEVLHPVDGVMTGKALFNSFNPFSMPSLIGDGEMEITLDLTTMTMTAVIAGENEGSIYETVADADSDLDGLTAYPSAEQEDAVVTNGEVSSDNADGYDFNFSTPAGEVIQPAGGVDTPIEFDENGTWTGDFIKSTAPSSSRRAVRAAAAQTARWHFDMPEGTSGKITMLIDERNSKLTIASSAHNRNYFIVPVINWNVAENGIEHLSTLSGNILKHTSEGIYEGEIEIGSELEESDMISIILASDCQLTTGIASPFSTPTMTTLDIMQQTEASLPALVPAANGISYPTYWNLNAPAGKVALRYDASNSILTASRGGAGVENVSADADSGFSVKTGEGAVTVTTGNAMHLQVYTVDGMLVRSVDILPGSTRIDLAPGFYIVNNVKVSVR